MSWKQLLAENKVHTHRTSKKEVDGLRELISRDLADEGAGFRAWRYLL